MLAVGAGGCLDIFFLCFQYAVLVIFNIQLYFIRLLLLLFSQYIEETKTDVSSHSRIKN